MFTFNGRTVIVTGAGSPRGLGREALLEFAKLGANVVAADMNLADAEEAAKQAWVLGSKAMAVHVDVTSPESVSTMIDAVCEGMGGVDVLVNSAGITQSIKFKDMSLEDFRRVVEVNLMGTFNCCKAVVNTMKLAQYGRIVNISSISGKQGGGVYGGAHYCASKAGVLGFSKSLARELVLDGITVNCVCPGAAATEIRKGISDELEKKIAESIPMKRVAKASEVAAAIIFLASQEASYITGEDIDVNGGAHMD